MDRRDAEALVMTRAGRYVATQQGLALSSRVMRWLVKEQPEVVRELLAEELPWLFWMPEQEQAKCLNEIVNHFAAGAETLAFEPLARAIREWEHTAEVWADPELAKRLGSAFPGNGGEIPRPVRERPRAKARK